MDSPNTMANTITGTQASIGPPLPMPSVSASQPHWKIATTTPNAAPAASRFMTAAVSGMTTLRNAISSSRNDSPTTAAMNSGILADSTWVKSTETAVCPNT